ncbi:sensor histidine kinase [Effusibacillus consociatus]|uniref:histidine kinase n=1 Tax=Effusibacillus consociatus TaxID=1117041 RepID=A0ABV9Q0Q0_9BACL
MRERMLRLAGIMLATAFLGEMKMNPFGETFRFSLGIAAFFFGMLWFRSVPVLVTGVLAGSTILWFRVGMDVFMDHAFFYESLSKHLPSAFYYFSFALIIHLTRLRDFFENPLRVGVVGALADLTSNYVELLIRHIIGESYPITWQSFLIMLLFGALRSFFVVGLYNMLSIRQVRALGEARQKELDRLLMINSNLYEETLYLRKSMSHLEEITRKSYQLYKRLMESDKSQANLALHIAEHVHEVKKDSQRILAGLSKIINQEELAPRLSISDLCGLVVRANEKYAELLGKHIEFEYQCDTHLSTNQVYALLSVLNNLVANAVEAIPSSGRIQIRVELDQGEMIFHVTDSGPGVSPEDRDWVFEPGYTTKYDLEGNPSTGIGLTHAQDIIQNLNGTLTIRDDQPDMTHFEIRIPIHQLHRREGV